MKGKELEDFKITSEVFKKTLASEIISTKPEDIPKRISEILSKCLKKKAIIEGDGLTQDIKATVYDKDI